MRAPSLTAGTALSMLAVAAVLATPASAQRPPIPTGDEPAARPADPAPPAREEPGPLTRRESRIRLGQYERAEHWSVRGIVLTGLGPAWHPDATPMVIDALGGKDERLQALALEALRRMDPDALRAVATPELVRLLIKDGFKERNELFAERLQEVLERIFPDADADRRSDWSNLWREREESYSPTTWSGPPDPDASKGRSVATAADRALDLSTAGLEICFAIDATGSMQPAIDAVIASAQETSEILEGFTSELRLATVIYRDHGDMPGGSDVVAPLTSNLARAYKALEKVNAGGGGDAPEAIEAGLESALSIDDVGWSAEANKLVIVVGDAPAHANGLKEALELAARASVDMGAAAGSTEKRRKRERSGRQEPPRSGERMEGRPFVISTIAVRHAGAGPGRRGPGRPGGRPGGGPAGGNDAASHMRQIAEAGRGLFATLEVGGDSEDTAGARALVGLVVRMSFGEKYEREVRAFLDVYFEYRAAGLY